MPLEGSKGTNKPNPATTERIIEKFKLIHKLKKRKRKKKTKRQNPNQQKQTQKNQDNSYSINTPIHSFLLMVAFMNFILMKKKIGNKREKN